MENLFRFWDNGYHSFFIAIYWISTYHLSVYKRQFTIPCSPLPHIFGKNGFDAT